MRQVQDRHLLQQGVPSGALEGGSQKRVLCQIVQCETKQFSNQPPRGMKVNEFFDVKIQISLTTKMLGQEPELNPVNSFFLYNQARDVFVYAGDRVELFNDHISRVQMVEGFFQSQSEREGCDVYCYTIDLCEEMVNNVECFVEFDVFEYAHLLFSMCAYHSDHAKPHKRARVEVSHTPNISC